MTSIGKNIKKIRTVKKLSQAAFAELFNLARPSVGAYEEGRAEPKIETINQIAHHFGLSIDLLINKELTVNDLYKFDLVLDEIKKVDLLQEEVRESQLVGGIGLVLEHMHLEYVVNYQNKDFISGLRQIYLPVTEKEKSRAFQLSGSEMEYNHNGLHHGDILLSKEISLTRGSKIQPGKVYVIVNKDGISIKRLSKKGKVLMFTSDDPNYDPIELTLENLFELWEVYGVFSTYLNPPSTIETRILQVENELKELKNKLK